MAGAKASAEEKNSIRDLVKSGYSIPEIQSRFPHVDGRIISGIHMRITSNSSGAPTGAGAGAAPAAAVPPMAGDKGVKTPQQEAAEATGMTPASETPHMPGGFKPSYREYFVVKKLDPPNPGVMKTEHPPFGVVELMERYPAGNYEIQHYREGRLFNTYRESISERAKNPTGSVIQPQAPKPDTPADLFLKAMDVFNRMDHNSRDRAAAAEAARAQAEAAKAEAGARTESVALAGLVDIVKQSSQPKADPISPSLDKLLLMLKDGNKAAEERHARAMEEMRERQKHELMMERERLKDERQKVQEDLRQREKDRDAFLAKMSELEKDRDKFHRESYDRMMAEIKDARNAVNEELAEKRQWMEELFKLQKDNADEFVKLKRDLGAGGDSLEMAKIIKEGIVGGLDRVGARVDMLVDKGVIPKGIEGNKPAAAGAAAPALTDASVNQAEGAPANNKVTKVMIEQAVKEVWFQDLQKEISRTVRKRIAAGEKGVKPHGSMLGQTFIDKVNEDVSRRPYFHYLCTRSWEELLADAEDGILPECRDDLVCEEAVKWFEEFQEYLTASWNSSIGVGG